VSRVILSQQKVRLNLDVLLYPFNSMPKLVGILKTALHVEDLERAAGFYEKVFGGSVSSARET